MTRDKSGDYGNLHTTMGTLPDQAAYVLLLNSDGAPNQRPVVKQAYQVGIGADATCNDMW